jgi:hypothetical protein
VPFWPDSLTGRRRAASLRTRRSALPSEARSRRPATDRVQLAPRSAVAGPTRRARGLHAQGAHWRISRFHCHWLPYQEHDRLHSHVKQFHRYTLSERFEDTGSGRTQPPGEGAERTSDRTEVVRVCTRRRVERAHDSVSRRAVSEPFSYAWRGFSCPQAVTSGFVCSRCPTISRASPHGLGFLISPRYGYERDGSCRAHF